MKVLVISGNPKKSGALASLTAEAARGASESGAEVEEVRLAEKNIGYCKFCMKCHEDIDSPVSYCVQKDDMNETLDKVREADALPSRGVNAFLHPLGQPAKEGAQRLPGLWQVAAFLQLSILSDVNLRTGCRAALRSLNAVA